MVQLFLERGLVAGFPWVREELPVDAGTVEAGVDWSVVGRAPDIGAYEFDDAMIPGGGLVVSITSDVFDGDYTAGNLSLREAVEGQLHARLPGGGLIKEAMG